MQVMACQVPTQDPTWDHPDISPGHTFKSVTSCVTSVIIHEGVVRLDACDLDILAVHSSQKMGLKLGMALMGAGQEGQDAALSCSTF